MALSEHPGLSINSATTATEQQALKLVTEPHAIACLTDDIKQKILNALASEGSASSISGPLGMPRQKLAYHVKKLEQAGLLKHLRDERKGNCTERILMATAKRYLLAPGALAADQSDADLQDSLSANHLLALAAECLDDLAEARTDASEQGLRLSTLSLVGQVSFTDQQQKVEFANALTEAFNHVVARFHSNSPDDSQQYRVFLGAYPKADPRN